MVIPSKTSGNSSKIDFTAEATPRLLFRREVRYQPLQRAVRYIG